MSFSAVTLCRGSQYYIFYQVYASSIMYELSEWYIIEDSLMVGKTISNIACWSKCSIFQICLLERNIFLKIFLMTLHAKSVFILIIHFISLHSLQQPNVFISHFFIALYMTFLLTLMLLVANLANTKWWKKLKYDWNPGSWDSSQSTERELSDEYQHDRV